MQMDKIGLISINLAEKLAMTVTESPYRVTADIISSTCPWISLLLLDFKRSKTQQIQKEISPRFSVNLKKENQKSVLLTVHAIERFVFCSEIAKGFIELIALTPAFAKMIEKHRYLRNFHRRDVSDATVMDYLRKHFFRLFFLNGHLYNGFKIMLFF